MSELKEHPIWPPGGITDLPEDWRKLAVQTVSDIIPVWEDARARLARTEQLRTFNEQLAREWSIETGVIEDVFHIDKGVTLNLIEHGISAALFEHGSTDRPVEYVIDILRDHIEALDWIFDQFVVHKQPLTVSGIKQLHGLMTGHQAYVDGRDTSGRPIRIPLRKGEWKVHPNNAIRDHVLYSYCSPFHVQEETERLLALHLAHDAAGVTPEVSAAWLHHRFTQIHPFQDGNGRVARALATMVFLRAGLFPLVITREARADYIDSLEQADAGNLAPLAQVFADAQQERFDRALNIAEGIGGTTMSVDMAIEAFKERLQTREGELAAGPQEAFDVSRRLEAITRSRLEEVRAKLSPLDSYVNFAKDHADTRFRIQVIESARQFGYVANTSAYRAWVLLSITADPAAQLLLAFHARGSEYTGVLVCAPIFELIEGGITQDRNQPMERLPFRVADKPFEFYYTEQPEEVEARFRPWLDDVIALALSQYQRIL